MVDLAGKIHNSLIARDKTLSVAESCTGGLLSKMLTDLPGSSSYFILGIVAYSNKAKESLLKVDSKIIQKEGAVSAKVAMAMANSVRNLAKADFGVVITGIAGPTGISVQKPVGLVFIAATSSKKSICSKFVFKGRRASIRKTASLKALELLNKIL